MKYLFLSIIVTMCQCMMIKRQPLPAPTGITVRIRDKPQEFDVTWNKVVSPEKGDPVLGYKVKIVQVKKVKKDVNVLNNKLNEIVEQEEYPVIDANKVPERHYTVLVVPFDKLLVSSKYIQGVSYEIRVLAYTKKREGPWSVHVKFKINDQDR